MPYLIDIPEIPQDLSLAVSQCSNDVLQVVWQLIDVHVHQQLELLKTLLSKIAAGAVFLHAGGTSSGEGIVNGIL